MPTRPSTAAAARRRRPPGSARHVSARKRPARSTFDHRRRHEESWSRAEAVARLDAPGRRTDQDPDQLWNRVGLKRGNTVVDVGAGTGFYSFPAARLVGSEGRVFAVDISSELVDLVRVRALERHLSNVVPTLSSRAHIPIEDAVADFAILANVLHGIPPATVDEAVRIVRPGGRVVDLDWKKEATRDGPPLDHRLTVEEAAATLSARGLRQVDSFDLGPQHYVLVFERPRPARHPARLVSAE